MRYFLRFCTVSDVAGLPTSLSFIKQAGSSCACFAWQRSICTYLSASCRVLLPYMLWCCDCALLGLYFVVGALG
jgi:hypothetical protein